MQCNLQLGQSEVAEGKPACMFWRSIPISDHAVMRLQPALPPMVTDSGKQHSAWTSEHAASVWAMEGYFMVCCLELPSMQTMGAIVDHSHAVDQAKSACCTVACIISLLIPQLFSQFTCMNLYMFLLLSFFVS